MPPESSWTAQHRGPVSPTAPTELLGPALCKGTGKAPRGAHTSPTATLLRKATQAFFAPSRPLAVGQSGAGLPLAPWALLICWGSPEPETHSQRVSFTAKQEWACEELLRPGPSNATRAKLGRATPSTCLPKGTNRAPGGCSLQGDRKRSLGSTHQPHRAKTQESNKSRFRTQAAARCWAKRGWAASGSLGPAAWLGVSGA